MNQIPEIPRENEEEQVELQVMQQRPSYPYRPFLSRDEFARCRREGAGKNEVSTTICCDSPVFVLFCA